MTAGCAGCVYLHPVEGYCDFLSKTNVTRGCKLRPGGGCDRKRTEPLERRDFKITKKQVSEADKRRKKGRAGRPKKDWDKAEAYRLYQEGLYDGEIAKALGVASMTINTWRRGQGLPTNWGKKKEVKKDA